jgi:hypothetical protein
MATPTMITTWAACVTSLKVVSKDLISSGDMAIVYISAEPIYVYGAFKELDLQKFDFATHCTSEHCFILERKYKCLILLQF